MSDSRNEGTFSLRGLLVIFFLTFAVLGVTVVAVVPSWRNQVRELLISTNRQIIAKTSGPLTPEGPFVTVLKIQEKGRLHLEVFRSDSPDSTQPTLMVRLDLPEGRDGYFVFQGNATNLVLSDMDKDGAMDIIAPTFDDQMTARLHVYRYNRVLQTFTRMTAPDEEPPQSP